MHGERYHDATQALAAIDRLQDENRQLREDNAKLQESLRIMSESAGNWEREAKSRGAVDWRAPR